MIKLRGKHVSKKQGRCGACLGLTYNVFRIQPYGMYNDAAEILDVPPDLKPYPVGPPVKTFFCNEDCYTLFLFKTGHA